MSNSPRGKRQALRRTHCLNPHPERVTDSLFRKHPFFDAHDLLQVKYEMLRKVQIDGDTVSHSTECFGLSRPSFYRALRAYEQHGLPGLVPDRPGPRQARKLKPHIMDALLQARQAIPPPTITELQQLVQERFGISVHRSSIERALTRTKKNTA